MEYLEERTHVSQIPSAKKHGAEEAGAETETGVNSYLRQIRSYTSLAKGEDQQLFREIAKGGPHADAARARLVEGVQKYVVRVARTFEGRGVELEDLIQEGTLGVLRAIEKFDPTQGNAFLTYADDWIKQRMQRACNNLGSIEKYQTRVPCHQYMANGRAQKLLPILQEELGREPTPEEIAKRDAEEHNGRGMSVSQAQWALTLLSRSIVPLDAQWAGDDSDVNLGEAIADDQALDPEKEMLAADRRAMIWRAFNELNEQEQQVLQMRLGLNPDDRKYTQDEVCKTLNIRKSTLVAIQKRALNQLAASPGIREIAHEVLEAI